MPAPRPKPWVQSISAYVPGRATSEDGRPLAKLSSNENPLGPSRAAIEAMQHAATHAHVYPEGSALDLRMALARRHAIEPDRIVCGAGSDELLDLIALAFAGPGEEVLMTRHCFAVYPLAARRVGATPVEAPDRDYTADVDQLLAHVTDRTRVLYLANPNNPTGTMIGRSEVHRLHRGLPESVLLVLDGAYAEYVDDPEYEDGLALAREAPNVITTRTFSKIHALAGQRIGWAYGPEPLIAALHKVRGPFNTTTAGVMGAVAALSDPSAEALAREHNQLWRDWLFAEFARLGNHGVRAVPSSANFVMLVFPEDGPVTAERAYRAMMEDGYITRWLAPQGMMNAVRVSVGTPEETRGVAASLRRFVESAA